MSIIELEVLSGMNLTDEEFSAALTIEADGLYGGLDFMEACTIVDRLIVETGSVAF